MTYNLYLDSRIVKPIINNDYYSSYAQYTIRLSNVGLRDFLKSELSSIGIQSQIYYPIPLHKQKAYEGSDSIQIPLVNSIELSKTCLSIPAHPYLTKSEVKKISKSINNIIEQYYLRK
jgi:dTDP-4-amino-4,6-dideoxygalactose transaminase